MEQSSLAVRDPAVPRHNPPHQVPLVAASSFVFEDLAQGVDIFDGQREGHIYGRFGNPTVDAAAAKIVALEGHGLSKPCYGLFCASGMAAIATVLLGCCEAGGAVLTPADIYGGTHSLLEQLASRGVGRVTANLRERAAVERAFAGQTTIQAVYVETPSNPTLTCYDMAMLAEVAHAHGARLVVDNTFATPILQQPLTHGADVVVHSTTKYMNGHGTGVAGAIVTADEAVFHEQFVPIYRLYGGSGNPWDAWLVLNGLKTLSLRMERHSKNARAVADFLQHHPRVKQVNYPGLEDHPDRPVADRQMRLPGGMLSFEVDGGEAGARSFMDALRFCTLTPTLGDVDTLVLHPATMSHRGLARELRLAHRITDGLVRLSVGVEAVEDILGDLDGALG